MARFFATCGEDATRWGMALGGFGSRCRDQWG